MYSFFTKSWSVHNRRIIVVFVTWSNISLLKIDYLPQKLRYRNKRGIHTLQGYNYTHMTHNTLYMCVNNNVYDIISSSP